MNDTHNQDTISGAKPETPAPEAPLKKRNVPLLEVAIIILLLGILFAGSFLRRSEGTMFGALVVLIPWALGASCFFVLSGLSSASQSRRAIIAKRLFWLGISLTLFTIFAVAVYATSPNQWLWTHLSFPLALSYSLSGGVPPVVGVALGLVGGISVVAFSKSKRILNPSARGKTRHSPVFNEPQQPRFERTPYPDQVGQQDVVLRPKSRVGFVLFALFLGAFGIHNFYALRIKSAVTQLLLTLFTGVALGVLTGIAYAAKWTWWLENGWLVAAIVEPVVILGVWIWSIVEICVVSRDGRGVPMQ